MMSAQLAHAVAQQDPALLPEFMRSGPGHLENWENAVETVYHGQQTGLPAMVHVEMNGQRFHTRSGVILASWLERGARIVAAPHENKGE